DTSEEVLYGTQDQRGEHPPAISRQETPKPTRKLFLLNHLRKTEPQRTNGQMSQEEKEMQRRKKENQHSGQRHDDHGPLTLSEEFYRRTDPIAGQSRYLPHRQRPEPLIENPLRLLSPNRVLTTTPESSTATLPPQNVAVDRLLNHLSYQGEIPEMNLDINTRRPRRYRRNRIQSLSPEVHNPSASDRFLAQQTLEAQQTLAAITMELPIRQTVAPTAGRRPFAASRGGFSQIRNPLPTGRSTPTEPGSQPESTPQDEMPHASSPSTPPSQLSPSMPSSPPLSSPRPL
ncbi:uncharacterized protein F4817DRAFT_364504, partial [Daldinia loculata]|uniref:uncharacterized protein n=1 Tax=Daldinia loculata TaxID=103429 RepID=UPI0020C4A8B4